MYSFRELVEREKKELIWKINYFENKIEEIQNGNIKVNEPGYEDTYIRHYQRFISDASNSLENIEDYTLMVIAEKCNRVAEVMCVSKDILIAKIDLSYFGLDEKSELVRNISSLNLENYIHIHEEIRQMIWNSIPGIPSKLMTIDEHYKIEKQYLDIKNDDNISNDEKAEMLYHYRLVSQRAGLKDDTASSWTKMYQCHSYRTPEQIREQSYNIYNRGGYGK